MGRCEVLRICAGVHLWMELLWRSSKSMDLRFAGPGGGEFFSGFSKGLTAPMHSRNTLLFGKQGWQQPGIA